MMDKLIAFFRARLNIPVMLSEGGPITDMSIDYEDGKRDEHEQVVT